MSGDDKVPHGETLRSLLGLALCARCGLSHGDGETHRCSTAFDRDDALEWELADEATARPFRMFLLDTTRPTVRTMTALSGSDPRDLNEAHDVKADDKDEPTSLLFEWANGEADQLDLPFEPNGLVSPFIAVSHRYGPAAVRDLLLVKALLWSRRARANEAVWTWPDELLELAGLSDSKENRSKLAKRLEALHNTRLSATYPGAEAPLRAAVLQTVADAGPAKLVMLHPALYRGVRREDGRLGNHWWPLALEAVRGRADRSGEGLAFVLAFVVAHLGRTNLRNGVVPPFPIGVSRLADYLGIKGDKRHQLDGRQAKTLRDTLEAAKPHILSGWEANGRLEAGGTVLTLEVAELAKAVAGSESTLERPAWLPATGDDLSLMLEKNGWSSIVASERLNVSSSTLRRVKNSGPSPLPARVRADIRHALWGQPAPLSTGGVHSRGGGRAVLLTEGGGVAPRQEHKAF